MYFRESLRHTVQLRSPRPLQHNCRKDTQCKRVNVWNHRGIDAVNSPNLQVVFLMSSLIESKRYIANKDLFDFITDIESADNHIFVRFNINVGWHFKYEIVETYLF